MLATEIVAGPSPSGATLTAAEAWSARLSFLAHQVAGEHLISGLPWERARRDNVAVHTWPRAGWVPFGPEEVDVRRDGPRVTATDPDGRSRAGVHVNGTQGVVQLPEGADAPAFEPRRVEPRPAGPEWAVEPDPGTQARAEALLARDPHCWAMLAVRGGRIVAEAYRPPYGPGSRNVTWSMGKSLAAGLAGVLVERGELELDEPTGLPEWAGDGRRAITLRHLLTMTAGLDCAHGDPASQWLHDRVYDGIGDVASFVLSRPALRPPGAAWAYSNADVLAAVELVLRRAGDRLAFAQRSLLDRVGMADVTLCTDDHGLPILTGLDYVTARDWARYGLLHLRGGVWHGDRVLPEGWVDFVSSPGGDGRYGAAFWLGDGWFSAAGWGGNAMWIVPARDLVVVRLRKPPTDDPVADPELA